MRYLSKMLPLLVVCGVVGVVTWAARSPLQSASQLTGAEPSELMPVERQIDAEFARRWTDQHVTPAPGAPALQVLRRLSLALHGSVPSLEEIRQFEEDSRPDVEKLNDWTRHMLADPRFGDYFAERLARAFVGKEDGQFVIYRRDRFVAWLSQQLKSGTPYDDIVRQMISSEGIATDRPATNFIVAAHDNADEKGNKLDENKLAGKSVRAFLGQRIDCAQCHNHPFDDWKQSQFEGLAAFYGQTAYTIVGVEDSATQKGKPVEYEVEDRKTLEQRVIKESVPFLDECLPTGGSRRERLATWITDPKNRRFERAIANRVWGYLFGRAYIEPVDDLQDPPDQPDVLDLLGRDFREHGYDLKRLVQVIAMSAPFRRDSGYADDIERDKQQLETAEAEWALFPLIRLRPEQVIGSVLQSASLQTVDQNSHLVQRTIKLFQSGGFVREYGDLGENELLDRGGTIPQRLLMLNGDLAGEASKAKPILSAVARIASLAPTDEKRVETAYLVCLTRRPTAEESAHFVGLFQQKQFKRNEIVEDLYWVLFNSTEFAWNH
ncbi:MAG: DUF1549 domain-containing protein [Planctomycetales bacterium]|nr:DUF1549 domain-containing protein [Planctomycetales bacterium]